MILIIFNGLLGVTVVFFALASFRLLLNGGDWDAQDARFLTRRFQTQSGVFLYLVQGEILAALSETASTVRVDVKEGQQLIQRTQVPLGNVFRPEELYVLSSLAQAEALNHRSPSNLSASSKRLFSAVLFAAPASFAERQVQVTVR